jgi:peptide/nickel transport system substrate-binding protein
MPDRQTQKAQLFTCGIDVMRDITADDSRLLAQQPGVSITATASKQILYITMDAAGRSASKALTDIRVRQAIIMAIDRESLINTYIPGGKSAERPNSICFKATTGCAPTTKPLSYDPGTAKRLLTEAGYGGGLKFTLHVYQPIKAVGEAIAGDLRKVGINVKIQPLKLQTYVRLRGQGKFTAFVGKYPTSAQPDVDNMLNFFFGANRDYYNDPIFKKARSDGATEFNVAKRTAIYQDALDQVNRKSYIFPVTENPIVFAHTKEILIKKNQVAADDTRLSEFFWK